MRVTIQDTQTGETAVAPWDEFDAFWWAQGNGSCDCNRQLAFGQDRGCECRSERYLIVAVEGDTGGRSINDFNSGYTQTGMTG